MHIYSRLLLGFLFTWSSSYLLCFKKAGRRLALFLVALGLLHWLWLFVMGMYTWAKELLITSGAGAWDPTQVINLVTDWIELAVRGGILVITLLILNHVRIRALFQAGSGGGREKPTITS